MGIQMNITIDPVSLDEKEILRNLLEKYDYEFSQYDNRDVNPLGLYGYDWLDCYWTEEGRYPFFMRVDGKLAGFAMVGNHMEVFKEAQYCMSEFCVLYKYRRMGVGGYAAKTIFDQFPGIWELKRHPKNLGSVYFWDHVIESYTGGNYTCIKGCPDNVYDDGTPADVFCFSTVRK